MFEMSNKLNKIWFKRINSRFFKYETKLVKVSKRLIPIFIEN